MENGDLNSECCEQGLNNLKIELVSVANQLLTNKTTSFTREFQQRAVKV